MCKLLSDKVILVILEIVGNNWLRKSEICRENFLEIFVQSLVSERNRSDVFQVEVLAKKLAKDYPRTEDKQYTVVY